jgi:uncharacterized protein YjeT (DUF2065 family)
VTTNDPSLAGLILGLVIILMRGPMLISPDWTAALYRRMVASDLRVRCLGVGTLALGVLLLALCWNADQTSASVISFFGWLIVLTSLALCLAFPGSYRNLVHFLLDLVTGTAARLWGLGLIGMGLLFIFLS